MAREFDTSIGPSRTRVWIEMGGIRRIVPTLTGTLGTGERRSIVIVTDRTVGSLYGPEVEKSLRAAGWKSTTASIEPGEASKSLATVEGLYQVFARAVLPRDGCVLALGGGVVSDVAGFAAATWMRGVRFVICPTTLEAQIDAAIGGKTAINLPSGKNLVGAFHPASVVLIDAECLATLDPRDVRAGMAESIKHAMITSEEFFAWHEEHVEDVMGVCAAADEPRRYTETDEPRRDTETDEPRRDTGSVALHGRRCEVMEELILRNVKIKAGIVERDPYETTGERRVLNFGHTIGHAIESACDYELRHGECVGLGMLAACRISNRLTGLPQSVTARLEKLLERFGLPTRLSTAGIACPTLLPTKQSAAGIAGPTSSSTIKGGQSPPYTTGLPTLPSTLGNARPTSPAASHAGQIPPEATPLAPVERIIDGMRLDKKVQDGRVQFVLLEDMGRPVARDDVGIEAVTCAYKSLMK